MVVHGITRVAHAIAQVAGWTWKKVLHPGLKLLWTIAKKVFHEVFRLVKDLARSLGGVIKTILRAVFFIIGWLVVLVAGGWFIFELFKHHFQLAPIGHDFMEIVWSWTRLLWKWV